MTVDEITSAPPSAPAAADGDGWEWAVVELFGHRRLSGRVREEERFGAKMLRIDIPVKGEPAVNGWTTQFYGGAAIFSVTFTDEAAVMRINRPYEPYRAQLAVRDDFADPDDEMSVAGDDEL
ncbi:hypothetical protein [Chelatococcus sp. XZ-Ab1]|uniref:hypothetical protein n=1 Tax=Chelatococcus sp. XZ-Ab1 TaxID=3034027 RepID=UPI0023E3B9C8|nr:hypothetical protein [Chelatococcus sp. XZ-Ab1]